MQSLRELSAFIPLHSLLLKCILALVIGLLVLVRDTQYPPLHPKNLELNMVVVEAINIRCLDRPPLIDSRLAHFEMD